MRACVFVCLCHLERHGRLLSSSPRDRSVQLHSYRPSQIPTARSLINCLASWEDSCCFFFKLGGKGGRGGSSLHSLRNWEQQQQSLQLPKDSSPLTDTLSWLETSTGEEDYSGLPAGPRGKDSTRRKERGKSAANDQSRINKAYQPRQESEARLH